MGIKYEHWRHAVFPHYIVLLKLKTRFKIINSIRRFPHYIVLLKLSGAEERNLTGFHTTKYFSNKLRYTAR